jgi:TonB family protein
MRPTSLRLLCLLVLGSLTARPLAAQNVLFTEHDGKFVPVVRVHVHAPLIEVDGKLMPEMGGRYHLEKADEYLPYLVDVQDVQVKTRHENMKGLTVNSEFRFRARFETPYDLDHVFIVLELDVEFIGKLIFAQEIGRLEPGHAKVIDIGVPVANRTGAGKYHLHLFSDGRELLRSDMPAQVREAAMDDMVTRRIAGVQDAGPKPFAGPNPEYPPALVKTKATGRAIITLRIGTNGQVYDPKVKSTTEPAFGESAVTAVRLWRFLPRVQNGHPVETTVDLPFDFTPPEKDRG